MTSLKTEILKQLNENGRLRFNQILKRIEQQKGVKRISGSASVKMATALNGLRLEELVTREYVARQSWYEITDKGLAALRKSQASTEISSEKPSGFANCETVISSDGKGDASVYWSGPIDLLTRKQISDIQAKYPGIKILGHTKKEQLGA